MNDRAARALLAAVLALAFGSTAIDAQAKLPDASFDLDRALSGGVGRVVTTATPPVAIPWHPVGGGKSGTPGVRFPRSICWAGDLLVVADGGPRQLVLFDAKGVEVRRVGRRGTSPGAFVDLGMVRCSRESGLLLAVDHGNHRITTLNLQGDVLRTAPTPDVPQIDIVGEYALAEDGTWFESWMGSEIPIGPYLSPERWRSVRLIRRFDVLGSLQHQFGIPVPYRNQVARRALNRVYVQLWRDTLWVMTQGDATIMGYSSDGRSVGGALRLPVHFRGQEPDVRLGAGHPASDFLPNEMRFDPNVADLTVVQDSAFAVIRYRDWALRLVGTGDDARRNRIARSAIDIVDRRGRILRSLGAPGMVIAVKSDGRRSLAILTKLDDGSRRVFVSSIQ